jgi:hypothetical protein
MVVATIYDSFWCISQQHSQRAASNFKKRIILILHCFSAKRNARAILSTNVDQDLSCLYGLRTLMMCITIIVHSMIIFTSKVKNAGTFFKVKIILQQ